MKKFDKLNKILLIDDDEATNFLNAFIINDSGIDVAIETVFTVNNALDLLSNETQQIQQPDLIFLDLNIPGLNGWDFLKGYQLLQQKLDLKPVIIILTTSFNPDDKLKAEQFPEVGGFLNKPLTRDSLIKVVEKYFQ